MGVVNLLAIETATPACAIGLRVDGVDDVRVLDRDRRHTEVLTAGIAQALADAGIGARGLDRVVVDRGPGLYTGLRVGLATAGALAQALGIGLVAVTSCELLAHAAATRGVAGSVLAVVDARRGEVFVQRFTLGDGRASALDEPAVARPDEVAPTLDESWTITGDGARRYGDLLCARGSALMNDVVPSPGAALDIGALREGVERVAPLYLRDADAVANFATRERP